MSDESFNRVADLPDAEIKGYLPPDVPLRLFAEPIEQLTGLDRSIAQFHRTMVVGHARLCAALDDLAQSRRQLANTWEQGLAETMKVIEPNRG